MVKDRQKDSVVMYRSQIEALLSLTSMKDVRSILSTIIEYGMNGNRNVEVPEHLAFGWIMIKQQIDMNNEKYSTLVQKRHEAGLRSASKRNQQNPTNSTSVNKSQQKQQVLNVSTNPTVYDNDNVYDNELSNDNYFIRSQADGEILPKSKEEVMDIVRSHHVGMSCTEEQAFDYIVDRESRDWIPYGQNYKIKTSRQLYADITKWFRRKDNEQRQKRLNDGTGKHFSNKPEDYGDDDDSAKV